jgi:flagellar basal body P-ring protein FlgI
MSTLTKEELEEIKKMVIEEFPDDPALQQIHMARKIIAKEAENEGLDYLEYIKSKNVKNRFSKSKVVISTKTGSVT